MTIFYYVPALVGVLFIAVGCYHGYRLRSLTRRCTVAAKGTVMGFKKKKLKSGELLFPIISYQAGNKKYMGQYSIGNAQWNMKRGDHIDLRYNQNNPSEIYLDKEQSKIQQYASPVSIIIGGIIFILAYYR